MGLAILFALTSGATWAIGMTAAKPALRSIDALSYMLWRWILVAPLALLYAVLSSTLVFGTWRGIGLAMIAGFLDSTLGGLFYLMAMERTPAYQASALSSTAPLWGVCAAILILGEPLRWTVLVAAVLVVGGAYFLFGQRVNIRRYLTGSLLALLTGFLWGFSETIPAKLALQQGLTPASFLFAFSCTGIVTIAMMIPILRSRFPRRMSRRGFSLTALSGVGGAFLGWFFWLSSLDRAPASVISPIRGSALVFALIYSVVFLRERPGMRSLLGVGLVLAGVVLVSLTV